MLIKAEANNLRISPRKLNLVASGLMGKKATDVLVSLRFVQKGAKAPLVKVLKSAISNATNNAKLEEKNLYIKEVQTMEGPRLKRSQPRSRGMAHRIIKRTSHLRIILEDKP
ncbi:MAG: 50S ribosomal protein L22 [Candidatus Woykebacteria bacterium RIFCSPHIGHO2_12_FULL_45_10]|uniref:Large ribosomal subunit protein uL22 n=1 Tax=Candidatus Woykebacteria bacterium RIFCSPHIGHO2_12_FULL_45_10 TaxID=1802603 RepID=A0A1G1WMJ8_9BACT|nr:MAG: 50S ribosomal protein L22 [Candidatus Woykebacteria bacterium RIFCSPHIGHO2_12_FULL_45_10]